ncbi:MAG: ubiquitin-like domain-containing protein [Micrococcales bacterium]|nr:ubiquitin-like domain-containing protein [Micrococcales bacterium]
MRLLVQLTVLALVVASTSAFALLHTSAVVVVDGQPVQVEGYARTVGDLLANEGIKVGERDLVIPSLDQRVPSKVVVQHAQQITVVVDGERQTVWTTAGSVGEVIDDLGLRDDVRASASRSDPVGRDTLLVSTVKTVHVVVDGQTIDAVTDGSTVRDALVDVGVVLAAADRLSVPLGATAVDGLAVVVTRAQSAGDTATEAVPYETQEVENSTMVKGDRKVATRGKAGVRTITYHVETLNGVVVSRTPIASTVTTAPVAEIVHIGTATVPPVGNVDPGSAQAIARDMVYARGWDEQQFACLVQLWNKESGWRVNAENKSSGAYGIPQALPGSKMATVADDWRTNPATQITWGLNYITSRYSTPCGAWSAFQSKGWY